MRFSDRLEAGRQLAKAWQAHKVSLPPYILGIPRGGVAVAYAMATALDAPLAALVARKISLPADPEFAVGAVTAQGPARWNEEFLAARPLSPALRRRLEEEAREEARRQQEMYGPLPPMAGYVPVVVDDGLATGLTMQAALATLPPGRKAWVAVPVASASALASLQALAPVVALHVPEPFFAVGAFYDDFRPVSTSQVRRFLTAAAGRERLELPPGCGGFPPPSGRPPREQG